MSFKGEVGWLREGLVNLSFVRCVRVLLMEAGHLGQSRP